MHVATALHKVIVDHGVSQNRLADMLDVDEKQVRKYLDGRAHFPAAALLILPLDMTEDFIARLREMRGQASPRAQILSALVELEAGGLSPDEKLDLIGRVSSLPARAK
jgi:hypothetical protein